MYENKRIIIYGYGKFKKDFMYIFDDLKVDYYVTEKQTESTYGIEKLETENVDDILVIICDFDKENVSRRLEAIGLKYNISYVFAEDLFSKLDYDFEKIVATRHIAFWGIGEERKLFEQKSNINCDFYLDRNIEKKGTSIKGKSVKHTSEIDDWKNIFVVITTLKYYEEIKKELISYGLQEEKDFIICRRLMYKQSELLRETILASPIKAPACNRPFTYIQIEEGGETYCCCPAWVKHSFGNITIDSCKDIWNSYIAKIFRLSIINKTFCFCKHDSCSQMQYNIEEDKSGERYEELKPLEQPDNVLLSIDGRCNLKCKQCRPKSYSNENIDKKLLQIYLEHIKESYWIENASSVTLAGNGEVFFNDTYQNLAFDLPKGKGKRINVISNGILFNYPNWLRVKNSYNEVVVSISVDAATEETYKKVRGGSWKVLKNNLEMLAKLKKNNEIIRFELTYCVMMDNVNEMGLFVQLAKKLCVDNVHFQQVHQSSLLTYEEFLTMAVINSDGTPKKELVEELKNPILLDPIVDLYQMKKYKEFIKN